MRSQYVLFREYRCNVLKGYYVNRRLALRLESAFDGQPVATATINIPEVDIKPNEAIIKDYSENAGILRVLREAGLVRETGRFVEMPYGDEAAICEVLF